MKKSADQVAVYAGTFDPITFGHRDIAIRAAQIFDTVIVAVAESSPKRALFSVDERVQLVREALAGATGNFRVEGFSGLLVDFVRQLKGRVIIRGLRAVSDYEYEAQMALMNRHLAHDIETVFLMTAEKYSFVNASIVRQVAQVRGDVSGLVPENVVAALAKKFKST